MVSTHSLAAAAALLIATFTGVIAQTSSAGCGKTPTLTNGQRTISVNGRNRQWILRLPDNYNKTNPYRLIFAPHWGDGDYTQVDGDVNGPYYGLRAQAKNTAIFVAPNGNNRGWANGNGEDVNFFDAMYAAITADLCVNTRAVHSIGFSYGGGMSYALACARPNIFRAVAVLSGAALSGCSGGTQPVAYYGQHGIRDTVLNISQGRSIRDRFVKNNGCAATNPREPSSGSKTHIGTDYSGCKAGYPVRWVAFDEGHYGTPQDSGGLGPAAWTPAEVWKFFSQFN